MSHVAHPTLTTDEGRTCQLSVPSQWGPVTHSFLLHGSTQAVVVLKKEVEPDEPDPLTASRMGMLTCLRR